MANTALSLGAVNGVGTDNPTKISNVVVGTNAPTASVDFEFRVAATDQNGNVVTRVEMLKALKAFKFAIESMAIFTSDLAQ
jgi:hypothetical protein